METSVISIVILAVLLPHACSLSCAASWPSSGSTCTDANYCTAEWATSSGHWKPISQGCTQTTSVLPNANRWYHLSSQVAVTVCNTTNNCNAVAPPNSLPTAPPLLNCSAGTTGNNMCFGEACMITSFPNTVKRTCDPELGFIFQQVTGTKFCVQTTMLTTGNTPITGSTCYCRSDNYCNSPALVTWGQNHYQPKNVTCNLGKGQSAKGQYCITQTKSNATSSSTYLIAATATQTYGYGCATIYGTTSTTTKSCTCNADHCNVLPATIMPATTSVANHKTTISTTPSKASHQYTILAMNSVIILFLLELMQTV